MTVDVSTPDAAPEPPPSLGILIGGTVLMCLTAGLAAVITATLVPLRIGTHLVWLAVLLAVLANVVLPLLTVRITGGAGPAALVVVVWVLVILLLSQSRPEGDVILPGAPSDVVAAVYATLLGGLVAGLVTVLLAGRRRPRAAGRERSDQR